MTQLLYLDRQYMSYEYVYCTILLLGYSKIRISYTALNFLICNYGKLKCAFKIQSR